MVPPFTTSEPKYCPAQIVCVTVLGAVVTAAGAVSAASVPVGDTATGETAFTSPPAVTVSICPNVNTSSAWTRKGKENSKAIPSPGAIRFIP